MDANATLDTLLKNATWYSAAAGAAGLIALPASGQIVYTNPEPDLEIVDTFESVKGSVIAGVDIDFDGDGNPEIIFAEANNGEYLLTDLSPGDSDDFVSGVFGALVPYGGNNYAYFAPLSAGAAVSSLAENLITGYGIATFTFLGSDPLNWTTSGESFIGVQFTLDTGNVHYAWLRVEVDAEGEQLTIKDYAFNATPDELIIAGATGVSNEADGPLIGTHRLSSVYPNPFDVEAQLTLEVGETQEVDVAVYNLLGRRVATLASRELSAGQVHTFTLDGRALPSGLYVVRAQGNAFSETVRVTVAH
ncbi:MAG: T9SS type A sorting domain-containing protein [Bacteroidota bacterium]